LAGVLAEIDKLAPVAAVAAVKPVAEVNVDTPAVEPGTVCPHCDAHFPKPMKFCGECGKAMA
jgi:rRNA maturation endonuclease Nob1